MTKRTLILATLALLIVGGLVVNIAAGQEAPPPEAVETTLHPTFPLLDADGQNVVASGQPASTMQTCGTCHDTDFIASHTDHSDAALTAITREVGFPQTPPAEAVEMNCFLCHMEGPDSAAYGAALERGDYAAANTATLMNTGIVDEELTWNPDAFTADGHLRDGLLTVGDPANDNCAMCHGTIHTDNATALTLDNIGWTTATSGQVFSAQRLSETGLNISGKNDLARSYDIHTERVVECVDCHHAANNPIYTQLASSDLEHLTFDPRRMDFGDYLERPNHTLSGTADSPLTCEGCHDATTTHEWLPYADRHTTVLACETCHSPELYAPAVQSTDWTVLTAEDTAVTEWRGVEGQPDDLSTDLIVPYAPVLLPEARGETTVLAPHNVITTWYWVDGETPISRADLRSVYFDAEGVYAADIVALFDADGDTTLSQAELLIDTAEEEEAIAAKLMDLGYSDPQIAGETLRYPINHNVTHGQWATESCESCHTADSRLTAPIVLAGRTPGGITPTFEGSAGQIEEVEDGLLRYQPETQPANGAITLYVLGHDAARWVDIAGIVLMLGTLGGVTVHGGLRVVAAKRMADRQHHAPVHEVYMYSVYERLWHWLQSGVIFILLFTGLVIHKPDLFGAFSFSWMVSIHNGMALILLINATLAAFYHLASGEIKQFLPQPRGFFSNAIEQSLYYLRGIFNDAPHPFEKTPERKLNPLQQIVYFGLLNVLLPLQVITGVLMWGLQRWPELTGALGGLPLLGPFHSLIAWLFATFIIAHIYLTTTGHTPLASIRGMILGWDEVEASAD